MTHKTTVKATIVSQHYIAHKSIFSLPAQRISAQVVFEADGSTQSQLLPIETFNVGRVVIVCGIVEEN